MFYVYMIGSVIVSLILIGAACSVPIYILREFDKMTYIKGYKQNLNWHKLPILLLLNISSFCCIILTLALALHASPFVFIILLIRFAQLLFDRRDRKAYKQTSRIVFVTPMLGMGLTYVLINGVSKLLYYLEINIISTVFNTICNALPYVIIMYYIILIFKQFKHLSFAEKIQLFNYREFKVKAIQHNDWVKAVLDSERAQEYLENYLLIYENESKWNESEYNVLNYSYFCLLLFKLSSIVIIVNCIIFFIGGTIYGSGNYTLMQVQSSMLLSIIITGSTVIILLLNWLFNKEIILSFKNKVKLTAKNVKMFFLSVIIGVIGIGILIAPKLDNSYIFSIERNITFDYNDFKNYIVHKVEVNRDYLNYNDYDKLEYIFKYPQYFTDDVKELGYDDNFVDGEINSNYSFYIEVDNAEFVESANTYYGGDHSYTLLVYKQKKNYVSLNVDQNADFVDVTISEDNKQNLNQKFNTEEEEQLGLLMKEEALKVSNSVWDEEMKDRGLI